MAEPIVFISRSRIREGRNAAFGAAFAEVVALIGSTKPRTSLFAGYLDETRADVRIVHVFPDATAMAAHFEGSEQRSQGAGSLIVPAGFEVYGRAAASAVDQLRREASDAGITLDMFAGSVGGFLRAP